MIKVMAKLLFRYIGAMAAVLIVLIILNQWQPETDETPPYVEVYEQGAVPIYFTSYEDIDETISSKIWQKTKERRNLKKFYKINVQKSDLIPLNRYIPDTRPQELNLPQASVVITYHNEWPSILLRTIFSVVDRTPKHLIKEIILVDDASTDPVTYDITKFLRKQTLDVPIVYKTMDSRSGLVRARLEAMKEIKGHVVVFLDSHMEVNRGWLEPLLLEISKDRRILVMGHLDYINSKTLDYNFIKDYRTRYGFDWRLHFFETYFRPSQTIDAVSTSTLPGVVAVGSAFAIDVSYFREIGMYDRGMKIWGGDNIELSIRIWSCGGRVLHAACSKVGHIARNQPYSFLDDRLNVELYNYKRIVEVWFDEYKEYVYDIYPQMKKIHPGDLSSQFAIRKQLFCKPFKWFLHNVWPELFPYKQNVEEWGMVVGRIQDSSPDLCLDNNRHLFPTPARLLVKPCTGDRVSQMMSLTKDEHLRTVLQCIVVAQENYDFVPLLHSCQDNKNISTWEYNVSM
ncbi:hypothetical protein FSP39_001044 [Pinctada imbricata]|uniref:Polypeptide N-acetylgalactosaminyltransferase n=1 Tax=Pinctada imbricata TaxID=66713 RepID=A0AA88Y2H0_PINIB|nr:hypothetical protein FSP39_001044 [Pinctada imbricata]